MMARAFVNWARNVRSAPTAWHHPRGEDELAALIRDARGRRIKVVGGGHSWSRIAAPEDLAVSLDRWTGILRIDRERGEVTVRAGTRLRDLVIGLALDDLALPIQGSITAQAVGGVIGTGTHGSSLVHGNLSSLVRRLRLIDGHGDAHDLGADDPRLDGARVHLGALGAITEVTLPVVPAFRLAETVESVALADVVANLPAIAASAEYCKVWWMPHTRRAQVFRYERTEEAASRRPDPVRQRWIDERVLHAVVFPALLRLGRVPGLTQRISRLAARGFEQPRRIGASGLMLSTPMPARHRETEAAMPMPRAADAFDRVVRLIERDRLDVNFLVEVRFVRGDTAWMSPAHGADTCQLGAYCHGRVSDPYFAAFWREMRAIGARPHWGKEMDHDARELAAQYPHMPRFRSLRDALDPDRTFASPFLSRTLGA